MLQQGGSGSGYKYATLRFLIHPERRIFVPVGVMLWNTQTHRLFWRFPRSEEVIEGLAYTEISPYLEVVRRHIEHWLSARTLPYANNEIEPLTPSWWEHVRDLLHFNITLDDSRPIDCREPEKELDALYEAVVKPSVSKKARKRRIDGRLKDALGPYANQFGRTKIAGYHGRDVPVSRGAKSNSVTIIVEAANLAGVGADDEADKLTSRVQRIREGNRTGEILFVLGYITSPGGLNGEAALRDWIQFKTGETLFDLSREQREFREQAQAALSKLSGHTPLKFN